ncbi:hypothetical protein F3683_22420, partial [Escherichia coli]|nr:hypothetical protein [Escherichia coli]
RQPSGKNIIRWLLKKRTNGSVRYCQYTSQNLILFLWFSVLTGEKSTKNMIVIIIKLYRIFSLISLSAPADKITPPDILLNMPFHMPLCVVCDIFFAQP